MTALAGAAAALWLLALLLPWRAWSTRERLEPVSADGAEPGPPGIGVLIPARNEAATIAETVRAVLDQDAVERIVVVDDRSDDDTAAQAAAVPGVDVIRGTATPPGWSGKLWAQQQGLERLDTPLVLLLDADIALAPGMVAALGNKLERDRLDQVSIMATLPAESLPERLMLPAFVYFFKQLYPFAWVNRADRPFAAAAGGCVLVRRAVLEGIGAFANWKGALIDDCELARRVRAAGGRIWIGLSHGVVSRRRHPDFASVLETVRRTAYTQLRYSPLWLGVTAVLMLVLFAVPPLTLIAAAGMAAPAPGAAAALAWGLMAAGYWPLVRFAGLAPAWAFSLPAAGLLFLWATFASAWAHHFGRGAGWKGRRYA